MVGDSIPATTSQDGAASEAVSPSDSLHPAIIATITLAVTLTTLFTAARLLAKRLTPHQRLAVEDYLTVSAWVLSLAYSIIIGLQARLGFGRHTRDLAPENIEQIELYSWVVELIYSPAIWVAKAALLFQLVRIFSPQKTGGVYVAIQLLIWGNFLLYFITFFGTLFQCIPVQKAWEPKVEGHCLDFASAIVATSAFNIFSDVLLLLLPMFTIWHLKLSTKAKAGVSAVFATGLITIAASVTRLVYSIKLRSSHDATFYVARVALWTQTEIVTVILCVCFPMIPKLFRIVTGRDRNSYQAFTAKFEGARFAQQEMRGSSRMSKCSQTGKCPDCELGLCDIGIGGVKHPSWRSSSTLDAGLTVHGHGSWYEDGNSTVSEIS